MNLVESKFFANGRTDLEVVKKLKKNANNIPRTSVATILARLVKDKVLAREGEGTKNSTWKYKKT